MSTNDDIFEAIGTRVPVWNLARIDPGYIYIIENHDRFKIGKTKNVAARKKAAKTWAPDGNWIGFKPFWAISHLERLLHTGFSRYWYANEWFKFDDEPEIRDLLLDNFTAFKDDDPDSNSVDFVH
ncbi:hypothetical protein GFK91_06155 [Roseibium aggregatum]|uniref:GIY-YIG nuclease family protein n=1 Tax=Roseibium aggregatum TaxID=187304 RepID=UPI001E5E4B26|nr:GIY-YIG nuclease family protein [Roseibium aggregatum]UES55224.1 hypothetical protein GFK91_06155 [Roseibium aggregatum]